VSLIARAYVDALGNERTVAPETVARFEALLMRDDRDFVAPSRVVREGEPIVLEVTLPAMSWPEALGWTVVREDGTRAEGALALRDAPDVSADASSGTTFDTRRITLDIEVPLGVHELTLNVDPYARAAVHLIVVPERAFAPAGRDWGISLQLYTLRSERNLGVGDFADLRAVCALLGDRGASYVGINPLHAAFRSDPEAASPYSPSSRRWLNWLAIAVDEVPEARAAAASALLTDPRLRARAARLRAAELVDYTGVAALKDDLLRACYAALVQDAERSAAFEAWCAAQGDPLRSFAVFEALVMRFGRDVAAWPAAYRTPDQPDVALYAAAVHDEVGYGMYLQWLADEQLEAAAADAARHGVALYRDLAVGVDANAADVWAYPAAYVADASVGAPPDVLNTLGQDWGLPPHHPHWLVHDGFTELAALLAANCRAAGALRIDHAFSLARLYWIPRGAGARTGTYVSYPIDDLRGIVALASVRERCVIVGEDLGTVPDGFRELMAATGILSYRILFFERRLDGTYDPPETYPALALAASGTHDLATLPAWLCGDDIALRDRLGLLETPVETEWRARERDRVLFLDALVGHGDLAPDARDDETAVVVAANRYLAASPAAVVVAQIDDILGERAPVNVPGTSTQYPNWRRKLHLDVDALAADEPLARLCATLAAVRPRTDPHTRHEAAR
jgi:4-alpha-glucanotransferase